MAENTTKIIDLEIKGAEALKTLSELSKELEAQKEILKKLKEAQKENGELTEQQADEMELATAMSKQLTKEMNQQRNVLRENAAESRAAEGSLKALRSQYNQLKATYESVGEVQRSEMVEQMKELKDRIEVADKAVGNYTTSIGNYEGAIKNAIPGFGKLQSVIKGLGIDATANARIMAGNMVQALKAVGNSMKALMANPLIAGIAIILATVMAIVEAVKKNQQAMDALQKIFAPFKMLVDLFFKSLGQVIGVIAEGIAKAIEFLAKFVPALNNAIEAEKTLQKLRQAEIEDIEKTAAGERKIAELKDKIAAKDKYTAEQRRQFAEEVKKQIEDQMKRETDRANLALKAFELQMSEAIRLNQLTDEEKKKYAELKSEIDKVATANMTRAKEATAVVAKTTATIEAEKKAVEAAEKEKRKQYAETARRRKELEKTIDEQLEDLATSLISSEKEREITEIENRAERQKKAIQKRLKEDADLTKAAREDLNATLVLLDAKLVQDIQAVNKKFSDAEFQRQVEQYQREFQQKVEHDEKLAAYEAQRQMDEAALKLEQRKIELNNQFEFEKEQAEKEHEMLINLDEQAKDKMFETQEAYELAVLKSNERVKQANSEVRKAEIEKATQLMQGISAIAGNMSQIFGQIAGKSKAMQGFQKALGLVQITTDMAIGIAGAIKAGAGLPFPANIPAILSGVGTVTAGIASAISTLKGTQNVQIPQQLMEGVRSQQIQTPTVSAPSIPSPTYTTTTLNLAGASMVNAGQGSQQQDISQAIKDAYKDMPAPIVKVSDIQAATIASENVRSISVV